MNLICPLCNGIGEEKFICIGCKEDMKDVGPLVDYLDEYSPYLSKDTTQLVDGVEDDKCVHILQCERCGYDKRKIIDMVHK